MNDIFVGKTKQKASDLAKKIAKAAKEEIVETAKSAGTQLKGAENSSTGYKLPPVVEAMMQGTQSVSDSEHEGIHSEEARKLDYLAKELEELRKRKKIELQEEKLQQVQGHQSREEPVIILQEPSTKRKRGMMGAKGQIEKKQGTREMGKQVSG